MYTNLKARWPSSQEASLAMEAAEFFADEGNDRFWQFIDRVVAHPDMIIDSPSSIMEVGCLYFLPSWVAQ